MAFLWCPSLFFTVTAIFQTATRKKGSEWSSICALSFTAITLLLQYKVVMNWVRFEVWAALMDVIPTVFKLLSGYVIIQLLLTAVALGIRRKMRSAG